MTVSETERILAAYDDARVRHLIRTKLWHCWRDARLESERHDLRMDADLLCKAMIAAERMTREEAEEMIGRSKRERNLPPPNHEPEPISLPASERSTL